MAEATTSPKEAALSILSEGLLSRDVLTTHCPLDYGRHHIKPTANLGKLDNLSVELQSLILLKTDLKSLLAFRRVSQRAMQVVNGMMEWKKILSNASNTIRMAIGIRTTHTFTLGQLFKILCQKKCEYCGNTAAYMDMFTLLRRCLHHRYRRIPSIPQKPRTADELMREYNITISEISYGPKFVAIPGNYGETTVYRRTTYYSASSPPSRMKDYREIRARGREEANAYSHCTARFFINEEDLADHLTVVVAPWLSTTSMLANYAVRCRVCLLGGGTGWQPNLFFSNPLQFPSKDTVYTEEELAGHIRSDHSKEHGTDGRKIAL